MKKIALLLCIIVSMGFTVAREDKAGSIVAKPARPTIDRAGGYLETTSPQAYTITLQ